MKQKLTIPVLRTMKKLGKDLGDARRRISTKRELAEEHLPKRIRKATKDESKDG